jgi:hypothetical protein
MLPAHPIASLLNGWNPYDPSWLLQLAHDQVPEEAWLAEALAKCTQARSAGSAYVYFVDNSRPNKPGSDWQFERNIVLFHPTEGEVIVDVLQGQRIGGVELWEKLLK